MQDARNTEIRAPSVTGDRSHYISRAGYVVRKDKVPASTIARIRRELHVCPFNPMQSKFAFGVDQKDGKFKVYRETGRKLYLPKFYGLSLFGPPGSDNPTVPAGGGGDDLRDMSQYQHTDILFHGTLRAEQKEVADAALHRLREIGGGILQLRCGFGKTILALNLIAELKVKTLIVVHKEFLLNQWVSRIDQFLPTARVGLVQQSLVDIEGKDIVIAMLQSLSMRAYPPSVFAGFGMCVFDECHHLGAEVFSRSLAKTATRFMLGLSATPDRKDNLRRVFEWYLGTVVASVDDGGTFHDVRVDVHLFCDPRVEETHTGIEARTIVHAAGGTIVYNEDNPGCRAKLLGHLASSPERMELVENQVAALTADPRRRVLVLSERRNHLIELGHRLAARSIEHGFYWGGEKQATLEVAATKQVILATFHMASEGFDVPSLNAVVLATPKGDVRQSVGRILRRRDHPVPPLVVDIVDDALPCFKRQLNTRKRFYRKSGFQIGGRCPKGVRPPSPPPLVGCAFIDVPAAPPVKS